MMPLVSQGQSQVTKPVQTELLGDPTWESHLASSPRPRRTLFTCALCSPYIYQHATGLKVAGELWEGNVFTGVCHYVNKVGYCNTPIWGHKSSLRRDLPERK